MLSSRSKNSRVLCVLLTPPPVAVRGAEGSGESARRARWRMVECVVEGRTMGVGDCCWVNDDNGERG